MKGGPIFRSRAALTATLDLYRFCCNPVGIGSHLALTGLRQLMRAADCIFCATKWAEGAKWDQVRVGSGLRGGPIAREVRYIGVGKRTRF